MPIKNNMPEWFNEALQSANAKLSHYRQLLSAVAEGRIRHLLISGDPGIGKSFEADSTLAKYANVSYSPQGQPYRFVKSPTNAVLRPNLRVRRYAGHSTPLALYIALYDGRAEHLAGVRSILCFDDCDSIFRNEQALNILKAATDTRDERIITWGSASSKVPAQQYRFNGQLIIISNGSFEHEKYRAFLDRVTHLPLRFTPEEKLAHLIQTVHNLPARTQPLRDAVSAWLLQKAPLFLEKLSIRSAVKALELASTSADNWQELAEVTLLS